MWKEILKKGLAVLVLIIFVPYIITVFVQGAEKKKSKDTLKEEGILRLSREASESYEDEMLCVQAILVRTSICLEQSEGTYVQTEESEVDLSSAWRQRLEKAWDSTEGLILTYEDAPILAPFHRLSNGKTRSGKEALGSEEYPYLQSVDCSKDVVAEEQIGSEVLDVENVKILNTDSSGYVTEVQMGEETCNGEQFRDAYGIVSASFEVYPAGDKTRIVTRGIGHGVGVSQHTANEMAKEGKNYEEILLYFFKNVKIQKSE